LAWDPQSGEGAKLYDGHFNRIGQPALYTSSRLETAWLEAQQGFAFKGQPMTMCTYRVDCEDVLDFRDPAHSQHMAFHTASLVNEISAEMATSKAKVEGYVRQVDGAVDQRADAVASKVQAHPLAAIGIATMAGYLRGWLTSGPIHMYRR
jgi:RES domain-containing protein